MIKVTVVKLGIKFCYLDFVLQSQMSVRLLIDLIFHGWN